MKVMESSLQSQANALHWQRRSEQSELRIEVRQPAPTPPTNDSARVELSPQALEASQSGDGNSPLDLKLQILVSVVEMLTGRRVKLFDASELSKPQDAVAAEPQPAGEDSRTPTANTPEVSLHFEYRAIREEAQLARYQASGKVTTADGRQIDFALQLDMARYEYEESSVTLDAGNARPKDPLVLNLGTDRARLLDERFSFDLEGDGKTEQLARLGSGSFFLALDRNGNGEIDSGKELFGPQSGNGFADLAELDQDGNGWIDEGDEAFSRLRLWRPDEAKLGLLEAGVGAIALDHRATPFDLKTASGETAGQIRSTGLYLSEQGAPGTLQQIDLLAT